MNKKFLLTCLLAATASFSYGQETSNQNKVMVQPVLQLFPNPMSTELTIVSNQPIKKVMIVNILGQTVYAADVNSTSIKINISHLAPGMYYVKADELQSLRVAKN